VEDENVPRTLGRLIRLASEGKAESDLDMKDMELMGGGKNECIESWLLEYIKYIASLKFFLYSAPFSSI